jgi:phage terminase large subunit-like protein
MTDLVKLDPFGSNLGRQGVLTPRISTPLNDFPSKGKEMVEFCEEIGFSLLPWQQWLAEHAHKYNPDTGKWINKINTLCISRQNGKSTFMALRILTGMFLWDEKMQVGTAHKLTTSSEIFYKIHEIIESSPSLSGELVKKIESKGSQELRLRNGARYLIRANNGSARGIAAVDTVHMDEVREYYDDDVWSSMRYAQMSAKNPQLWLYSSAGDQHSIVLNRIREQALANIAMGKSEGLGYFEWSGLPGAPIDADDPKFWESIAMANPSLGYTIDPDNIRAVLTDDETTIRTEVLTTWVTTSNPVVDPSLWAACASESQKLDKESDTWMAIDLTPDRKAAALVGAQKIDGQEGHYRVALLGTWTNDKTLDDRQLANDIGDWVAKFNTQVVAYSARTSGAVAARLKPAGIRVEPIDGIDYAQSCDMMLSAIAAKRLHHINQPELTRQVLSAVKLPQGDGGWIMGRKVSNATIAAAVATAMVSSFATRSESEIDIFVE